MLGHMYPTLLAEYAGATHPTPKRADEPLTARSLFSGGYTWKVTPVPIPNTAVKLLGPMVVPKVRE